jgi:hypothetical protein
MKKSIKFILNSEFSWFSWNKIVFYGVLFSVLFIPLMNIIVDPYFIFNFSKNDLQANVNERYNKVDYLLNKDNKYDAFIIGSSTMDSFDPSIAQSLRSHENWYNLSFLSGSPVEALNSLKILKKQGKPIKEVIMGIDFFSLCEFNKKSSDWNKEHFLITGQSKFSWYLDYLFAPSFSDSFSKLKINYTHNPVMFSDINGNGQYHFLAWGKSNLDKGNSLTEVNNKTLPASFILINDRLTELSNLSSWLKENKITAHFWINPYSQDSLSKVDVKTLYLFRHKIKEVLGDIPDYTLRVDINSNKNNFYDLQHFNANVSNQIMHEILFDN